MPLIQVVLPQLDKLLAESRADASQLPLSVSDRDVSGLDFSSLVAAQVRFL